MDISCNRQALRLHCIEPVTFHCSTRVRFQTHAHKRRCSKNSFVSQQQVPCTGILVPFFLCCSSHFKSPRAAENRSPPKRPRRAGFANRWKNPSPFVVIEIRIENNLNNRYTPRTPTEQLETSRPTTVARELRSVRGDPSHARSDESPGSGMTLDPQRERIHAPGHRSRSDFRQATLTAFGP